MARKKRKPRRKTTQKRRKPQKGGAISWVVDFKKGFKVTKDMIEAAKKPIDEEKAKRTVRGYKDEYREYKRRGGSKSYNSWVIDKGYGKRASSCTIM